MTDNSWPNIHLKIGSKCYEIFYFMITFTKKKEEMNSRIISIMIFCANINFIEIECNVYIL